MYMCVRDSVLFLSEPGYAPYYIYIYIYIIFLASYTGNLTNRVEYEENRERKENVRSRKLVR